MKSILLSIKPQYVAKILNGEKTIEIRKKFPSDYVGWVYIYVTKGKPLFVCKDSKGIVVKLHDSKKNVLEQLCVNGKVVARFWCDKVESFEFCEFSKHKDNRELYNECVIKDNELCKKACISCVQMVQYLDTKAIGKDMFGKAIHITKLEIFEKPKELKEFYKNGYDKVRYKTMRTEENDSWRLNRAPQSYCFIEV